jgi:hypothetical protein
VILIGSDATHHGLAAVSLYAETEFLDAVLDPVDQLLFLLERYLRHLGSALSSVHFETSFLVLVHAGSFGLIARTTCTGAFVFSFYAT